MEHWAHNDLLDVLFRYAPTFGASAEEICAAIDLDIEKATALGGIVPSSKLVDAVEWCAERSGYPGFGLLAAQHTDHRMTGLAGLIGERGLSLAQHFDLVGHHLPLHNTGFSFRFDPDPAGPSSRMIMHCKGAWPARHFVEGVMAVQTRMLQRMMGSGWRLAGVEFAHGPLGGEAAYGAAFNAPVRFEASRNALLFRPEDLLWRSNGPEYQSEIAVDAQLRDLALVEATDLVAKVERLVKARLPAPTNVTVAAAELGMSPRSLQRRLAAEGASWTEIVTRARVILAQEYLRHPGVSTMEVASRLGFRHPSVLSRMLKRELGASPKTLRK
jgi:AraC-like DNA-binding protein